jgi:class 3 adenylate cyclase/CheY-like chemotaxis protein
VSTDPAALSHLRHELRTPLNHIIGYSEMLLEDAVEGVASNLEPGLRMLHDTAQHLLATINDFLGQQRLEAGEVDLSLLSAEASAPLAAIASAVDALTLQARESGPDGARADLERIASAVSALRTMIADEDLSQSPPAPAAPQSDAEPASVSGAAETGLILIVDDNTANREMLARRVEREGHRVLQASSGREALDIVRRRPIDLVLLDVMMPEMDGYAVLQELKADPAWRHVPVLMISALDELDSVVRCIELGAEDYLPKPFNPILLRARLNACLENKRLRDREARHAEELEQWNRTLEQRVAEQVALVDRLGRLKRFFSPQLAELIVTGGAEDPLKTHRREVTVCFLDLRGFTAFAETAEPEEVMGVLREYHAEMGRLILEHEGTLERFTGDGMMIFFNDPVPIPNPGERAVRMALAMRECAARLCDKWRKLGYELDQGIGIAQGYATIGAIGFEGRWDYGAIGSVTNLAARLCAEAKPGQILISKRVLAMTEDLLAVESAGTLALAGFQRPIPAYTVVGLRE